jgi:fructose-1,6-bisphosphatase/inositol monophosphatase family enzyme
MSDWHQELSAAKDAAALAGAEAMRHFGGRIESRAKADGSPVTPVDSTCEEIIGARLRDEFPEYGFIGEESNGADGAPGDIAWIVDPIDGTREFISGNPAWAVFIALQVDSSRVLGLMFSPPNDEWAWAIRGSGAYYNDRPAKLSRSRKLSESCIVHGDPQRMAEAGYGEFVSAIRETAGECLTTADVAGPMAVLSGRAAAMIDRGQVWDHAAPEAIVLEAGGRFTNYEGDHVIGGGTGVISNGLVHEEIMALYSSTQTRRG